MTDNSHTVVYPHFQQGLTFYGSRGGEDLTTTHLYYDRASPIGPFQVLFLNEPKTLDCMEKSKHRPQKHQTNLNLVLTK